MTLAGHCPELDLLLTLTGADSRLTDTPDGHALSGVLLFGRGVTASVLIEGRELIVNAPSDSVTRRVQQAVQMFLNPVRDGWSLTVPLA